MPSFLLDSNFFITAHRMHYPMDVVPSFWVKVQDLANRGLISSIDKVENELIRGKDVLTDWIADNLPSNFFINTSTVISQYALVSQWAWSKNAHYSLSALNEFLHVDEADAWLVATAIHGGHTVVTHEMSNPGMKNRIKLPEPCNHFNVSFCNTINMFRSLGIAF